MLSRKKKILVVDDEPTQRQLLLNILQRVPHYQVIEAHDGLSALETLKKEAVHEVTAERSEAENQRMRQFEAERSEVVHEVTTEQSEQVDLIILDVRMPNMDGFEILAAIREDEELSRIPVIMCTAVSERKDVMRILQQGVASYIVKPINKGSLLPKVQQTLGIVDAVSNQTAASESYHTQPVTDSFTYLALIADEYKHFRRIVSRILRPYYDIIEASDGAKATQLIIDKRPQVILLGELSDTPNALDVLHKSRSIIQQENIKVYRIFSTASEALTEQVLEEYQGRMIRTPDANLLHSRIHRMMALPDFTISRQKSAVIVVLKNSYPQTNEEKRMFLRAVAAALDSDAQTVRFHLSDWESESTDTQKIANRHLEDIITELKSLDIKVEIIGSSLAMLVMLVTDKMAELRQEYIDYLTPRIARLQQYRKVGNVEAITSLGENLNNFGKEHGFPKIALLADMLIRESNNNHWDVVEALIQQLLHEQKDIAKDPVQLVN